MMKARSNLALACQPKVEEALWEDYCYQAHQAAEKALKAVYQSNGLMFDFIHDIDRLAVGLEKAGIVIPPEVRQAVKLNTYAYDSRYPQALDLVTEKDLNAALVLAEAVVRWAEKIIEKSDEKGVSEKRATYRVSKKATKDHLKRKSAKELLSKRGRVKIAPR